MVEKRTRSMQNLPYTQRKSSVSWKILSVRKKPEQPSRKRKPEQRSGMIYADMLDVSALGLGTLARCYDLAMIARRRAVATNARPLTAPHSISHHHTTLRVLLVLFSVVDGSSGFRPRTAFIRKKLR